MNDVNGLVDDVGVVVAHSANAVPDPIYRQYPQPTQNLRNLWVLKNVSPRNEHLLLAVGGENNQGIGEGIAVVGSENICTARRNVLFPNDLVSLEPSPDVIIYRVP